MPSVRRLASGRWQATVRLPDGARREKIFPGGRDAHQWARVTEAAISRAASHSQPAFTWSADGLHVHVPDELITMDIAAALERALRDVLAEQV